MYLNWIPALRTADVVTALSEKRALKRDSKRAAFESAKSDRDWAVTATARAAA